MCRVIDIKTRQSYYIGMIDIYRAPAGLLGIDACVPEDVACDMLGARRAAAFVAHSNGMVAFDLCLPASEAQRAIERARAAGVNVRR